MSDEPTGTTATAEVRIRRAPKYPVFLVLGALVGFLGTLILTALFPADPSVGFAPLFGYFLVFGIPIGVVLGALVAIILDRVSIVRAKNLTAEQVIVDPIPFEGELED